KKRKMRPSGYGCWANMLNRCRNENTPSYPNYGGRGITVCARWHKFENFIADMGPRPSRKHTIERKETNGNYEPGNCVWATRRVQNANKRNNHRLTIGGETRHVSEWARRAGLHVQTVLWRLRNGVPPAEAVQPGRKLRTRYTRGEQGRFA